MEVIRITKETHYPSPCVTALGFFDGVHAGHRVLLARTVEEARRRGMVAAVFTFDSSNQNYKTGTPRLTTPEERLRLFEACGIDCVFLADFSSLAHLSPEMFVANTLRTAIHTELALVGFNFRFGRGAVGDADTLVSLMQANGGDAVVLPPERLEDGRLISSTAIRTAVEEGDMKTASDMLGHPFCLASVVLHGNAFGRTIGIPTINQAFPRDTVIPAYGVYATTVTIDGKEYLGVTNVGVRPTISGIGINCETNIIHFEDDVYGKLAETRFLKMLRPERRFPSVEALRLQIESDKQEVIRQYDNRMDETNSTRRA